MIGLEEDIEYKGFTIQVRRLGAGWIARMRRPDGILMPRSPLTDDILKRDMVIEQARARITSLSFAAPDSV
jgi:hypothetical protein